MVMVVKKFDLIMLLSFTIYKSTTGKKLAVIIHPSHDNITHRLTNETFVLFIKRKCHMTVYVPHMHITDCAVCGVMCCLWCNVLPMVLLAVYVFILCLLFIVADI